MESPPSLLDELQADGLTPAQAQAAVAALALGPPPTAMFDGALWSHDLIDIRRRVDSGTATNDDACRLLAEVGRLHRIVGWQVNDPDVRAALTTRAEKLTPRDRLD